MNDYPVRLTAPQLDLLLGMLGVNERKCGIQLHTAQNEEERAFYSDALVKMNRVSALLEAAHPRRSDTSQDAEED